MIDSPQFEMAAAHLIRVIFLLACCVTPACFAEFTPLARRIPLPEGFDNRPVWAVDRLESGQFVVVIEGATLIGNPASGWKTHKAPDGPPAHIARSGHGKVLLISTAGGSLVNEYIVQPILSLGGRSFSAEVVPEGWLVGGEHGVSLVHPDGSIEHIAGAGSPGDRVTVKTNREAVLAFGDKGGIHIWRNGRLEEYFNPALPNPVPVNFAENGAWYTDKGLFTDDGTQQLPFNTLSKVYSEHLLISLLGGQERVYFATLNGGIVSFESKRPESEIQWRELGGVYCVSKYRDFYLIGTSEGLFGLANPDEIAIRTLSGLDFLKLQATADGVFLIRFGTSEVIEGESILEKLEGFPKVESARAIGRQLTFGAQKARTRFPSSECLGIAVADGTAAFCFRDGLEILNGETQKTVRLEQDFCRLESDGHQYFVATMAHGVQVISKTGEVVRTIGHGKSRARALPDGRILLLFSNGEIRESDGKLIATCVDGEPRDVAVVSGKLVFLLTRSDGPPVLREFDQGRWRSLEVLGLASVIAESMVAYRDKLYIAGRRGVLKIRLPLAASKAPEPLYRWSAPAIDDRVVIPDVDVSNASIAPGFWEPDIEPGTSIRIRVDDGFWTNIRAGAEFQIPVGWGETRVQLIAERNLLRSERTFTVVRPYPWWMRAWAWPIHAAVIALLVWLGVRWRTRQLEERARELETRVGERTTALVRANASREEFLATVGHEIRNPLNGLVGIAMILQDTDMGPREKNFVRVLAGCADQLRAIMDDVTEYSRADRGQVILNPTPFELGTLVEQCARVMDPTLGSCSLQVPDSAVWLLGDSGKVRQILCNLIGNALKYGQPREAGIEVRAAPGTQPDQVLVRVAVRNTGPTIPAGELPYLFEPFRRGSNTTEIKGSGLGLTVSRKLAVAMSGRLNVTSANGSTEFVLELAFPRSQEPVKVPPVEKPVSRALAIEDEDYNRLVLGHVLRELGYEVDWAPDGMSALRLAARQTYDLIITDWRLPDIAGDELCRRLQKVLGEPRPPIIAVTAFTAGEKFDAARAAGMAGFLTKPVTREKMEHLIRRLAEGLNPRATVDVPVRPPAEPTLAQLGQLGPSMEKLAVDIVARWAEAKAQAELQDPRASRTAHALRSLLLLAGEEDVAEQMGLLETNSAENDWETVGQLLPFLSEEIAAVRDRLKLS